MPPEHCWGQRHMLPHPPQFSLSDEKSAQNPPQFWSPACRETRRQERLSNFDVNPIFEGKGCSLMRRVATASCAAHAHENIRIPSTACHP